MCVLMHAGRQEIQNLMGYKHLTHAYAIAVSGDVLLCASLELLCILKVLWPWAFAICSVIFTDRIRGQMAVSK